MYNLMKYIHKIFKESDKIIQKENILKILIVQNRLFFYHIAVILIFSIIYYYVAIYKGTSKDKKRMNSYFDCFYFTTITHFTVGFGDIAPDAYILKILVVIQVLIAFILMNR